MSDFSQAINPITGTINWQCTCMGNNPIGPCGELFKEAFKCFVKYQKTPEKCQSKINLMQTCQEKYPKLY
jgi:intermembrane space import and assembly protein 40